MKYDINRSAIEARLTQRASDGGLVAISAGRVEQSPHGVAFPVFWADATYQQYSEEVERVADLLAGEGEWSLDAHWDVTAPPADAADVEGQAILSLDIRRDGQHVTWSVLMFNLPEVVEELRAFHENAGAMIFAREPPHGADAGGGQTPMVMIAIHRRAEIVGWLLDRYRDLGYLGD